MSAKDNMFDPANVRPKTSDVIGKERHYYSYPGESECCSALLPSLSCEGEKRVWGSD